VASSPNFSPIEEPFSKLKAFLDAKREPERKRNFMRRSFKPLERLALKMLKAGFGTVAISLKD